ncbi:MAG: hypothetical protein B7Z31_04030 [Rhodobacterales bacterium 12-65-15]|nr:MAG: hypothetical protein B7Z31_04030 [Rhodobacterales bacterium 12-65-15]
MRHSDFARLKPQPSKALDADPRTRLAARQKAYLAYLRRRIADPSAAEDVLQDFNLKVISATNRTKPIRNTDAWLACILRNSLFDHYRRRDARRRAERAYCDHVLLFSATVEGATGALPPSEDVDAVETALGNLRPDYAELIRALYLRSVPRAAFALEIGVEVGTLNVRALRARRALRACLDHQSERSAECRLTGARPEMEIAK